MPIGPAPKTMAVPPGSTRERSTPLNATDIGSISAPCSRVMPSGSGWTRCAGTDVNSARPPPGALEADRRDGVAHLRRAARAAGALAAAEQRFDAHAITDADRVHAVTDGGDDARELVTQHLGQDGAGQPVRDVRDRGGAGEVLVQVGSADAVVGDPDLHLTGAGFGFGDVVESDVAGAVESGSAHPRH